MSNTSKKYFISLIKTINNSFEHIQYFPIFQLESKKHNKNPILRFTYYALLILLWSLFSENHHIGYGILEHLCKVPRFSMVSMFMKDQEKLGMEQFFVSFIFNTVNHLNRAWTLYSAITVLAWKAWSKYRGTGTAATSSIKNLIRTEILQ